MRSVELKEQSRRFLAEILRALKSGNLDDINASEWKATRNLLDDFSRSRARPYALGLNTTEAHQKSRDNMIRRRAQELFELSTPVVQLWDKIFALPLIGTLDSEGTQTVMENLLNTVVSTRAEIAIIAITGVPTVATLVGQHLMKTVAAARLMGADCIISGIRPQIAQTIVHLRPRFYVVSKATMADAFELESALSNLECRKPRPRSGLLWTCS